MTIAKTRRFVRASELMTNTAIELESQQEIIEIYRLIVIVLFICWTPALANRIQNSVAPGNPIFWLYLLHGALQPLQGFFNVLIYVYPSIKKGFQTSNTIKYSRVDDSKYGNFLQMYNEQD